MTGFRHSRGFSLIELLAATAVAVLIVAATTGSVLAAQHLQVRGAAASARLAAAATLWERLRSLPFCSPALPPQATLTQTVFPHAATLPDAAGGRLYLEPHDGRPAGTFFATVRQDGFAFQVAATFCVADAGGFAALPVARLGSYSPLTPPAGHLLVRVRPAGDPTDLLAGVLPGAQRSAGSQ
jgi:prepilin-type N-terminal cleavage/methylation domain-containing protein